MTRNVPGHVHAFELTKTSSAAVTFHLRPSQLARDGYAYHAGGWALATVNNETGELAIQSDWGNWSYRWNVQHLGANVSLLQFIADRDPGHCDYIADKLAGRDQSQCFDAQKTVKAMQRHFCERRLEAGRAIIEYYREDERTVPPIFDHCPAWLEGVEVQTYGKKEKWPFDGPTTRGVFDSLEELASIDNPSEFTTAFYEIEGHQMVTEEPWEWTCTSPSSAYEQLLHGILPAVVEACRKRVAVA